MTFKEKFEMDTGKKFPSNAFTRGCPSDYGYEKEECFKCLFEQITCEECWNRECDDFTVKPEYQHFMNRFMEVV